MTQQALLALDTSAHYISVAFLCNEVRYAHAQLLGKNSTRIIPSLLDDIQKRMPSAPTGIIYGSGPGSFTGVRIALAVASAIALAHNIPLTPISSFTSYAYQTSLYMDSIAQQQQHMRVLINAGSGGYYYATIALKDAYVHQQYTAFYPMLDAVDVAHTDVDVDWIACGPGWRHLPDTHASLWDGCVWYMLQQHPDATSMIAMVQSYAGAQWHTVDALPQLNYMQPSVHSVA